MVNPLFTPSHLKLLCQTYGISPSKSYGQHFLISDAPIRDMIAAGELERGDTVVEIGPGFGVLTFAIAPRVQKVIAFEIEQKLRSYWEEKQKEYPNVEIVWGNVLTQASLLLPLKSTTPNPSFPRMGEYKVLANLPYHITSDVLRMFLESVRRPERMVVMVQKEVAERICAKPGDMSMLAVSVQYYGTPRIVRRVPRGCFWPAPAVDSAVVCIETKERKNERTEEPVDDQRFFAIVRAGFAQKRRQLWRNLAGGLHIDPARAKQAVRSAAGRETARAEELSVEQWRGLVADVLSVGHTRLDAVQGRSEHPSEA